MFAGHVMDFIARFAITLYSVILIAAIYFSILVFKSGDRKEESEVKKEAVKCKQRS